MKNLLHICNGPSLVDHECSHSYEVIHKNINYSHVIINCRNIYLKNNFYKLHFLK